MEKRKVWKKDRLSVDYLDLRKAEKRVGQKDGRRELMMEKDSVHLKDAMSALTKESSSARLWVHRLVCSTVDLKEVM